MKIITRFFLCALLALYCKEEVFAYRFSARPSVATKQIISNSCLSLKRLPSDSCNIHPVQAIATNLDVSTMNPLQDMTGISFSSLNGKALQSKTFPSLAEVKSIMPAGTYDKSTPLSLSFAAMDIVFSAIPAFLGIKFLLPQVFALWASGSIANQMLASILFLFYSVVTGTCTMGMWVTAHECGHGAFSDNRKLQDFVGYLFHSFLLVPYFSWQRSHAVHHANTNNIIDGETHVPPIQKNEAADSEKKSFQKVLGNSFGEKIYGAVQLFFHLVIGWPAYLMFGATGGPSRGITNHFFPYQTPRPGSEFSKLKDLFPGSWKGKVYLSDVGVVGMVAALGLLAQKFGLAWVAAAYGGPYLVVNAWLVLYTWLQHTDVDIPHLPSENFSFMKGAFHTVDRPYDKLLFGTIDFMHHHIGSTHVAHHIDCTIPHYRARAATDALKSQYPDQYLYESTPIFAALWRIAKKCFSVVKRSNSNNEEMYVFVDKQ